MAMFKRAAYLNWDEYFMSVAVLSGYRSKDPETPVGACIVNEKSAIVGVGYNGMPRLPKHLEQNNDDLLPWGQLVANFSTDEVFIQRHHWFVCHAVANAIVNKNCSSLEGCTIYVERFPCAECAKLIIQTGIKKVVYKYDNPNDITHKVARRLLQTTEVECTLFANPRNLQKIEINFQNIPPPVGENVPQAPQDA